MKSTKINGVAPRAAKTTTGGSMAAKPSGNLSEVMVMNRNWKHHPNALFEDSKGGLWIGYNTGVPRLKAVTTIEALTWLTEVSELADDQTFDVADIARIALKEIQRLLLSLGSVVALGRADKSKR